MRLSAGWLFGAAAGFNIVVGLALLFQRPWLEAILQLDPITGSNLMLLVLTAGFILLFAYAYARIALDPVTWRPFIGFCVIGKTAAAASILACWLLGQVAWTLPALGSGDLIFAGLFLIYLRQTSAA